MKIPLVLAFESIPLQKVEIPYIYLRSFLITPKSIFSRFTFFLELKFETWIPWNYNLRVFMCELLPWNSEHCLIIANTAIYFKDDGDDEQPQIRDETCTTEHLHRLYIFALTWGIGGVLASTERVKMNQYVRKTFTSLDLPKDPEMPNASIFDFFVS